MAPQDAELQSKQLSQRHDMQLEVKKQKLVMSTMKETQTQRPFLSDNLNTHVKSVVPGRFSFSDLWVWVYWIVLRSSAERRGTRSCRSARRSRRKHFLLLMS